MKGFSSPFTMPSSNSSSSSFPPSSTTPSISPFSPSSNTSSSQQTSFWFSSGPTMHSFSTRSSPSLFTSTGMSSGTSSFCSSLSANNSSISVPTVTTYNLFSDCQPSSASNPFSGSSFASGFPAYSSPIFGVVSSPAFGFPTSSSSTTGSLPFGPSLVSTSSSFSTSLSTASTAFPTQPLFGASSSVVPSSASPLFAASAASLTAGISSTLSPSGPVTGLTNSLATNTSTSASKSTTVSSATNSPSTLSPFPSFSFPAKISAPTPSSQPQPTTNAAMSVLAIKNGMERTQLENSDLVEVGVQSDLPAHKVKQVAGSEILRSGLSEAEACVEKMQVENTDLEVGAQPVLLADRVNRADGSEIVETGPKGFLPMDKIVDQLETSARSVDVLADYPSTDDQPVDQIVVERTPVDTLKEFKAASSFQESELNRIFPNLYVSVEGFLVPRPYVELYGKILRRYGHMATTEVITDCPLGLVGVATEVMRLFEEIASCTKADLSDDLLRRWDFRLSSAESLKFKVDWLRQRLEEIKSSYRRQIEHADAIDAARSSFAVTESKLTAVIARRKDHLKEKQAAEASLKAAEAALATVNATLEQDDEEISVFEAEKLGQLVKLCVVEGDFIPGVTLASDLL